jgi:excisionase family DNA binding protein
MLRGDGVLARTSIVLPPGEFPERRKGHLAVQQLLSLDEVSERLRLSRRTIESLVASGELGSILVRRRRRVPVEVMDEFITGKLPLVNTESDGPVIGRETS